MKGFSEDAEINLIISKTLALKLNSVKKLRYGKNYYVLYNPQNVDSWRKYILSENEIARRRKLLGINDNDIVIGRLGRAEPVKVDYLLLKSAPLIAKKFPNVKFIFWGLPKLYKFFLERNKHLAGRVVFMPQISDDEKVAEFYQIIDILWHTACRGETFGNVITEAMIFKK
ncbi:MAG: glycosyltransferase, partial [Candidatus Jordarchaeaceae archaeon]